MNCRTIQSLKYKCKWLKVVFLMNDQFQGTAFMLGGNPVTQRGEKHNVAFLIQEHMLI